MPRLPVSEVALVGAQALSPEKWWVRHFHEERLCVELPTTPTLSTADYHKLNMDFIREELTEMDDSWQEGNLPELVDGIGDAVYYLLGYALRLGVDLGPVLYEIHLANMEKAHDPSGADGGKRVSKPEGWEPPRIAELLVVQ